MSDLDDFRTAKDEFFRADQQSPLTPDQRRSFAGLHYYAERPELALELRPEVNKHPDRVEMLTSTGGTAVYARWAKVRFQVDGQPAELTVYRDIGSSELFLPFQDANAGGETYGAGRYLEVPELEDGRLAVDFNYAYNPYCAYNEHWSCPIPPPENHLQVAIRAGEMTYDAGHDMASGNGPRLEAVIFDWGGTLSKYAMVEMEDMWLLAARHLAPKREIEVAAQLAAVEDSFWQRSAADHRAWKLADLLTEARTTLGEDVAEAVLAEAGVRYLDAWTPHIRHEADAVDVLRALRTRGLRIGLLSNTHWPRAFHERFLERDGLVDLIDVRLYTSEMSHTKPHAEAFRAALAALEVSDASKAVFVGDRLYDDVYGAKQVGMRGVLRRNPAVPTYDVKPDAAIERLSDLLSHIDGWR